ncbi:MAG: hypothetical protein A2958_01015 [Candidatus Levybacteria bacterium RIFCSPLOWO2_01_FULL_38_13]|nr:MAG: hypothetical protein A2629_00910 [Candidatus Levybacteria bacterium RIFCSPHIGHO2_01_FULL_41_15]OGH34868.1 MAG: hypothetical protein A2958_01015 [Candidatus Levybacteria bacterium RIFCSPLOWO2_01_FULL_38_13]
MTNKILYWGIGILVLILALGGYLLLSRPGNLKYLQEEKQAAPLTRQNADSSLQQTESNIETQLNQADQDLKAAEEADISTQTQEDLSTINGL